MPKKFKPKQVRWSKRKVVGTIGVDSGSILLCDPCYVIPRDSELAERYGNRWSKFVEDSLAFQTEGAPEMPEVDAANYKQWVKKLEDYTRAARKFKSRPFFNMNFDAGHTGLATMIATGSDGEFKVEMRERGEEKEIRIRF